MPFDVRGDLLMHPTLRRLDELGAHLATRGDVVALLGVGSAGADTDRFDDHSDLDFFVVVDDGAKPRYLAEIDWLSSPCPVAYDFVNDRNGRKALYADGIFVEYAIFTVAELSGIPYVGARIVWQRTDAPNGLETAGRPPSANEGDTVDFHLNEALTNLYVGVHRELRGERLTAARFIQSYAIDHVIALLDLTTGGTRAGRDGFESSRRVEQAYSLDILPLAAMMPGYEHNFPAAQAILVWLEQGFAADPVIAAAIRELLAQ